MAIPKSVYIREVGPREGFQTLSKVVLTEQKLSLIDALSETGVKEIEITSLVRPDLVPQMADADEVIKRYQRKPHIKYTALYLNLKGFVRAEESGRLDNTGWLAVAASETFLKKNSNTDLNTIVSEIPEWAAQLEKHSKKLHGVMVSTAFGCNYEGEISTERLIAVLSKIHIAASDSGQSVKEFCLADTVGRGNPEEVRRKVNKVREIFSGVEVSLHLHDTRGTGMPNVYAGLLEGVTIFDASVGGLGGCPFAKGAAGNVPTEDVIYLCHELGIQTGIDLDKYIKAAKVAELIVGEKLPGKRYRAV